MKVKFCCDNGANIHSKRTETVDTKNDLGLEDGEWEDLTEEEKYEHVKQWAFEQFEYWFEEEE